MATTILAPIRSNRDPTLRALRGTTTRRGSYRRATMLAGAASLAIGSSVSIILIAAMMGSADHQHVARVVDRPGTELPQEALAKQERVGVGESDATVKLDPNGVVFPRPTERQLDPTALPSSQAKTVTNFTVFKNVEPGDDRMDVPEQR